MFKPLFAFIGFRYSRAKHKNKFVSFISASSILGIMLGVAVLIIGLSSMNGFEKALRDQLLSVIPHAEIEMVNGGFTDIEKTLNNVRNSPHVLGATPYISIDGLLQKNNKMKALQIRGVSPETERSVTNLEKYINEGGWELLSDPIEGRNSIILGSSIAEKLGVKVGEKVTLLLPRKSDKRFSSPKKVHFQLTGIFKMGGQLDNALGFIHINSAKNILGMKNINGIAFKVDDVLNANQIARDVAYTLSVYVYIKSWISSQGYLYQDIQMVKSLMYVILLLVLCVACFNIVSTLVMAVNEKRADIAILKTFGASNWTLRGIFMVQGAFNGFIGTFLGAIVGVLIAKNLTTMIKFIESIIGHKFLSTDIYFIDFLPSEINYQQVFIISIVAFLMSILSTIYPAWQASKVVPAIELSNSH